VQALNEADAEGNALQAEGKTLQALEGVDAKSTLQAAGPQNNPRALDEVVAESGSPRSGDHTTGPVDVRL
jgi:hypothetical protein